MENEDLTKLTKFELTADQEARQNAIIEQVRD